MKEFIKKPESWTKPVVAVRAMSNVVDPNRQRIEAKIAEIKAKLSKK